MKRITTLIAALILVFGLAAANAAEEKKAEPAKDAQPAPSMSCPKMQGGGMGGMQHGDMGGMQHGGMGGMKGGMGGMMHGGMGCPMKKSHQEMMGVVKDMLKLQQRALNASADEKKKIADELAALSAKMDAMDASAKCMMMQHGADQAPKADQAPAKDDKKPAGHNH